ncbi:ketoacyl-synt-domain-containing protein [Xylariaceae sp. AK1471]|nr:ketoacyl-synt-domain-containing protein [Xylariaceae sp. AK1471]
MMLSSNLDALFLFGDHTGDILQSIQDASSLAPHSSSMSTFFDRSIDRLHKSITKTSPRVHELHLYKNSPLELALAIKADLSGGSSAVATALLCISQFADVIVHLEANPRALEKSATSAVSCCRNLTEVLSIADEVRSTYLEPLPSSSSSGPPYTWATLVHNIDASQLYVSAFGNGFLPNCEKTPLPIRAAFHAKHLDHISWNHLIGNASLALLNMNVEHPLTFADLLRQVNLTDQVSCPLLEPYLKSPPGSQQIEGLRSSPQARSASQAAIPAAMPHADPRDIAIIGMGIRLPGSETLEEFWSVLEDGRDLHERVPADRFDLSTHFDSSGIKPNMSSTPHLFKMSPREARQTDPQQRLLLLATYEALEMAGRVGSFVGQTSDDYREVNASQDIDTHFIPGGMRAFGPGRLHYHFGWEGPSYSLAVSALLSKECDMAIGGGVNLLTSPDLFTGLCRGGFLSTTGGCKTFDDGADGYCRGDAVGAVDRDVVHAVLRGAMTNHSAGAISITHPHAETQERLFTTLLNKLNLSPDDINYVEMHGTGTQAGDATEMSSVINALARGNRTAANPLYVGSVKPNLGHGEGGSGVTSLIKAVMMLRKNTIPPHVGIKSRINRKLPPMAEFHTHLSMGKTPFSPRPGRDEPRRILINNFDAAGGNTSMVIQDPPPLPIEGADPRSHHVVTISGKTMNSAHENAQRLLDYIKQHPEARLEDIAYTTTVRRLHHQVYRQAYAVSSVDGLCRSLERTILGNDPTTRITHDTSTAPPFVTFAFTGQGCQYVSMASELFHTYPPFRESLESMAQICVSQGFASFLPLITDPHIDFSQASPVQMQTAIVAIEIAIVGLWKHMGVTPDAVIGHSLGELAALCIAGVISVANCLYLTGRRATLMAERCTAGTHAMLVVHESLQCIEGYLASMSEQSRDGSEQNLCEIACVNSAASTVVSGPAQQIRSLQQQLLASGVRVSLLEVPFAFHSSQMDVILNDYEAEAEQVSFMAPRIPIASTALGTLVTERGTINGGYLRRQTRGRVQFSQAVDALRQKSSGLSNTRRRVWIEVGPHTACLSSIRSNLQQFTKESDFFLPSMRKGEDDWKVMAGTVAAAYRAGVVIDWRQYHKPFEKALRLLELPSYAFDLQNYWIQYEGDWSQRKGRPGGANYGCSAKISNERSLDTPSLYRIQSKQVNAKEVSITFASEVSDPRLIDVLHGHRVNGNKLFSSSVYAEMALAAARHTQSLANPARAGAQDKSCMDVRDMEVSEPLIVEREDSKQLVLITAYQAKGSDTIRIRFRSQVGSNQKEHAKCAVVFGDSNTWLSEWRQSARLVQARIDHLTSSSLNGPTHRILRPMVYKLFNTLVDYDQPYQGMQEVYLDSEIQEATANVRFLAEANDLFVYHPCWIDSLAHISGFVLNGADTTPADTVYISHGWKSMRVAVAELSPSKTYQTYVRMKEDLGAPGVMVGDVYAIEDGDVIAFIEDIKFRRIKRYQLEHFLPSGKEQSTGNISRDMRRASKSMTQLNIPGIGSEMAQDAQGKGVNENDYQLSPIDVIFDIIAQEVGIGVGDLPDHALLADSGVDSLLALSIAARVKDTLEWEVPSSLFFSSITVAELRANLIDYYGLHSSSSNTENTTAESTETTASDAEEEISSDGEPSDENSFKTETKLDLEARLSLLQCSNPKATKKTVLFLFPDGAGRASSYTWLSAADFGSASLDAIYGLDSPFVGDNDAALSDVPLGDVVGSFIRAIRAVQPHGPYHLGGWSIGGVFAFEAARQLEDVSSLFLIDPPCPRVLDGKQNGAGSTVYGFETASQIIDIAKLVHGNGNGDIRTGDEDTMQALFAGSMQRLEKYRPLPLHMPQLRTTLLWAKQGVVETLGTDAESQTLHSVSNGEINGHSNAASNWVLNPRQNYGPNGWDMLLRETSILCCVVDGDHFSIMKNPAVCEVGRTLGRSFMSLHGSK